MQRIWLISLFGFSLGIAVWSSGCGTRIRQPSVTWQHRLSQASLGQSQFTEIIAERLSEADRKAVVHVVSPMTIKIDLEVGETTCHLSNLWQQSQAATPADRIELVKQYVDGLKETLERLQQNEPADIEQIVPLIKSKKWLAETDEQGMNLYREGLAADMFVIYAEDGPNQLRFVDRLTNEGFGLSAKEVRAKALANLKTRMPSPQRYGGGPLYMLTAGGVFEASLLLYSDVWDDVEEAVDGRIVVGVPSRELLMFTGENATEAIQQMRAIAEDTLPEGDYVISKELLIRNAGHWESFKDKNEVPQSPVGR